MLGLYTPLLILQAFCVYHAYQSNAEQRWYWLIIFFPGVGCLIYLYHHFYSRRNMETLAQGVQQVVNSNYKIERLEKALRFADNITNQINLADAYVEIGRYADALELYNACLSGFMREDPELKGKVLNCHFRQQDYASVIVWSKQLESEKTFRNSEGRIAYAWALHHVGNSAAAANVFEDMNKSFTNYKHRLAYCHFLIDTKKPDELIALLTELLEEFEHMKGPERRHHRDVIRAVKEIYANQKPG